MAEIPKGKNDYYICSIYCRDLNDYPYFPFVAKNTNSAIVKYLYFAMNESKMCPNPELHVIGTCRLTEQGSICKIQRGMYVYELDTESCKAKVLYHTAQLQERVSKCLDRFFLNLREFSQFLEKNMKKYLKIEIIRKEN